VSHRDTNTLDSAVTMLVVGVAFALWKRRLEQPLLFVAGFLSLHAPGRWFFQALGRDQSLARPTPLEIGLGLVGLALAMAPEFLTMLSARRVATDSAH
jgi:hypothetical protein